MRAVLTRACLLALLAALFGSPPTTAAGERRAFAGPDTITVRSGRLALRAVVYRPRGRGPFPAVLFNHGSGHASGRDARGVLDYRRPDLLGPIFARHGYVFFHLYRRGDGLSRGQGEAAADIMDRENALHGQEARNRVQMRLLEDGDLRDVLAGLKALRRLSFVDPRRVAAIGHSFGGSLTLLLTERDPSLRAAVIFSGAGYSWDRSPPLRERLLRAVRRSGVPTFFIHASNDYSVHAGEQMSAEMERLGKPHRLAIYPPVSNKPEDAHSMLYLAAGLWQSDVFAFLDRWTAQPAGGRGARGRSG